MRAKDALGRYGEDVAAQHLVDQGMRILDRNWRCKIGEIDIVALDGSSVVVCEVKTRGGYGFGSPLEAITAAKAARLRRLAGCWLADQSGHPNEIRFDLIGVVQTGRGAAEVEHLRGVQL